MNTSTYPGFTRLPNHRHRPLTKKIFTVSPGFYTFVGWATSNFSAILGPEGWILIDSGDDPVVAREALAEIRKLTDKPLAGVVLTHSHPDHTMGAVGFLEGEDPNLPVWGRSNFGGEAAGFQGLERITGRRAGRQFGLGIPPERYTVNSLVPKPAVFGGPETKMLRPNKFFAGEKQELRLAGLNLELYAAPGETSDQLFIWFPASQVLICADNMYRSFPNLYPIRGSGYRDVASWAESLRRMRAFNPKAVILGHTEPAEGEEGLSMLENYAAAIQYVYDETLKGMNEGRTADELAATIRLPEHLRNLDYLGEYYGCVPWAVRSIFSGKLGWFDGNPVNLAPLAPQEEAEHMAALAGGAAGLLAAAREALDSGHCRWAARLADTCLRLPGSGALHQDARRLLAAALEIMSGEILPITGKNYLMSCALELRASEAGKSGGGS